MVYKDYSFLKAKQPIGTMYVCVIDKSFILKIAESDLRRNESDCRDVEEYVGIQRPLDKTRKKEIGKYVNLADAAFPNSIILSIPSNKVEFSQDGNKIRIADEEAIASILDGQHRLAGLENLEKDKDFDCIVTLFIDMELEDQATIFATINSEQKKVNSSLVADLAEYYKTRNPQRTCHNIARVLNTMENSPLHRKIARLGTPNKKEGETLTQAAFVKQLLSLISRTPLQDRDILKNKDIFGRRGTLKYDPSEHAKTCFRKLFIEDESDTKIALVLRNYFRAVSNKWPTSWDDTQTSVLIKTTGYIALMRLLSNLYLRIGKDIPSTEDFGSFFDKIDISDGSFTNDKYPSGGVGQSAMYNDLIVGL